MRHATLRTGLPVLALLLLAGCSGDDAPGSEAAVASGDAADCPGEVLDVVVSVGSWSDVVRQLGGDCATVTTIEPDADVPPQVADGDHAAFAAADLVVLNGARLDAWATGAVETAGGDPVVVSAAELAGPPGAGQDENPYLWYDPAVVPDVAAAVARELAALSPDAAPYFGAQHTAWKTALQPWLEAVATLEADADGRTYAATGAVFDRMADAVGLADATPPGYPRVVPAGSTPPAGDVAEFAASVRDGTVDVVVQVGDDLPDELRDAADDSDVPVVAVTAAPDGDTPFVEWQLAQLGALAEALAEDR